MNSKIKIEEVKLFIEELKKKDFDYVLEMVGVESENRASVAFTNIDNLLIEEVIKECPQNILGKVQGLRMNKVMQDLELKSDEYFVWYDFQSFFSELKVDMYVKYFDRAVAKQMALDVSEVGKIEYIAQKNITRAGNKFTKKWLATSGSILSTKERMDKGFNNKLAEIVIDPETKEVTESPWHVAYKNEVQELVDAYDLLINELSLYLLKEMNPKDRELANKKIAYYKSLVEGYKNSDENYFHTVIEELFAAQADNRVDTPIHIHHFEYGYSHDGVQRIPSGVLRLADKNHEKVNAEAETVKQRMILHAKKMQAELGLSLGFVENITVLDSKTSFFAAHFLRNMDELIFPPAGQILPNDEKARIRGGINITLAVDTLPKRLLLQKELALIFFGPDFEKVMGEVGIGNILAAARTIASHEFSHGLGVNLTTFERIPLTLVSQFIEEWKATVGGMVLDEWVTWQDSKTDENFNFLRFSIVTHLLSAQRYTKMRSESSAQPYLRKSIGLITLLEDCGVLQKIPGKNNWTVDLEKNKVLDFYTRLQDQYKKVIKIYDSGTEAEMRDVLNNEILKYGKCVQDMFAVHTLEVQGDYSEAAICKLV